MNDEIKQEFRELVKIQGQNGNWNNDPYMHGLYNGLEFGLATLEERDAKFRDAPKKWGSKPQQIVRPILKLLYFLERKYNRYFGAKPIAEKQ